MELLTQAWEAEQQELLRIIGSALVEIQEEQELVQNKLFCCVIQLTEKLSEIMGQLLKIGNSHHLHDLNGLSFYVFI